ncbi:ankyrin repeat protein [Colletotrichum chrysophilum]|uniref:Ankyrin repeat protein n=1 Tax=Colletotrichum chrysophilum TaxID=1836956 RepID=A0AAD9EFD7_9PEZI|nr:ankyrin repeat protein [Colletotrichum chrysophilum]
MSIGFGVGDFIAVFDKAKKYKDRFRDAPDHLDSLNREITALCAVPQGIDLIKDDLDDYETHALEAPVRECSKLLNEIESLFKADDHSSQQSKVSRLKRIKSDVDQVQKLRLRVSLNVQLLHVVKQFKDSHAIKVIGDQVSTLKDDSANQQRQKILEWLDRDNYYPQYRKHLERRQQGSCQWFLESTGVQTWIANKGDGLLCHGIPGCGKTVISSIVIDHLFWQFERDKNIGILFIFCDAQDQEEGTFHRYVSNVTKQLVQAQSEIPASVRELYEMHQKLHSSRREMETVDLLFRLATICTSRLFIIVDGLDEFLLAELMVESVKDMRTPRQVRKALYGAPRRYTEYYHDAWMRVKKQNETDARLAMSVITWVVCAKRPLWIAELQHALATEDEEQIYEDNIFSAEDILSVCLGLVRVDAHSNVRLVHQATVESFEAEKNNAGVFQRADAEMTSICVRYLSFDQTRRSAERYSGELQNIHFGHTLDKNIPFGQYAAEHWGDHARDARRFPYCVWEFLDNPAALATSWKMFTKARTGKVPLKRAHIAALFGILHVFEGRFLTPEETFAYEGDPRRMPLYFAVREGHADVVKLLLDSPALLRQLRVPETFHENVFHSQNPAPHSAIRAMLAEAVEVRSATTVDVLIKFCAREQLRAEVPRETWPLVDRASREDTSVLKALVGQHNTAEGFSIETIAELGLQIEPSLVSYTPLLYAASKGNVGVVELLWRFGANLEARDGLGKTPLRCAVESGRLDVVIRLHN